MEERPVVIIKKKKRTRRDTHHGGSWKVAYADFVTAMMAFFLLLWLITMVSQEKRLALSEYFKNFNVFKEQTFSASKGIMDKQDSLLGDFVRHKVSGDKTNQVVVIKVKQEIAEKLKNAVDVRLESFKDQILIDIVDDGVRIQLVDKEGSVMFHLGSADPTDRAKRIIATITESIKELPNKVAIEGHTDSSPYRGTQITNWELSAARASSARREMEKNGLDPSKIARVVGFADQQLFMKENPTDPRNRRISIIVIARPEEVVEKEQ